MYENGIAWMVGHATQTSVERELGMRDRAQARELSEAILAAGRGSHLASFASAARRGAMRVAVVLGVVRRPAAASACCAGA